MMRSCFGRSKLKDGFFVYSGLLVPEGERPVFEKFVRQIFTHFDPLLRCYRERIYQNLTGEDAAVVSLVVQPVLEAAVDEAAIGDLAL